MCIRSLIVLLFCFAGIAQAQQKPDPEWMDQKFSMFIHWGLYSELGGVWDEKPVTRGYSEQIQSFAGIFSDWYAAVADRFNPEKWDADAIVKLAKDAGMKSIVFTSKHHDGFCMYHSKYTDFNIVDATPFKRDVMKELSEACRKQGIRFSVYYSLIDWHFPEAYPISSHNADPVTPAHHAYSMKQVEEIMTNYGPISEIWFDMGSLRAEQSRELYELVTRLQPHCMVSGRLGNDRGDFAVMADNFYPDYKIGVPWQTPASFFDETWSYRSWQERGDVDRKIEEKLKSLVKVVGRGGNYLLNIGPRGDGSVVEFERDALLEIGKWLGKYGDAVYATQATSFEHPFPWGEITRKGNRLFLFIEELPADRKLVLEGIVGTVDKAGLLAGAQELPVEHKGKRMVLTFPESVTPERGMVVAEISFRDGFKVVPEQPVKGRKLDVSNTIPVYAYSSMDYYSRFRSIVGYTWHFERDAKQFSPEMRYTAGDQGKVLQLTVDGTTRELVLEGGKPEKLKNNVKGIVWKSSYMAGPEKGRFAEKSIGEGELLEMASQSGQWQEKTDFEPGVSYRIPVKEKQSVHWVHELVSEKAQSLLIEVGRADALQVTLNGQVMLKRTYVGGNPMENEIIILPLKKGYNQLVVKLHNRYGDEIAYLLNPALPQEIYRLRLDAFPLWEGNMHEVSLRPAFPENKNSDIGMRDIQLIF